MLSQKNVSHGVPSASRFSNSAPTPARDSRPTYSIRRKGLWPGGVISRWDGVDAVYHESLVLQISGEIAVGENRASDSQARLPVAAPFLRLTGLP
jgi:hypothetical protein